MGAGPRDPEVPASAPIAAGFRLAARGCAWLARGDVERATEELRSLDEVLGGLRPEQQGFLGIARNELAGLLAEATGDADRALARLETAVRLEDALPYYEPPLWQHPVRLTLGHVLLRAGRPREAQAVFREDLRRIPESGRALFGLEKALEALGEEDRAARIGRRFREAWRGEELPVVLGLAADPSGGGHREASARPDTLTERQRHAIDAAMGHDLDGDGVLSRDEFPIPLFPVLDENHDGGVEREEVAALIVKIVRPFRWDNPPEADRSGIGVTHRSFVSPSQGTRVGYNVYLPPGYDDPADPCATR